MIGYTDPMTPTPRYGHLLPLDPTRSYPILDRGEGVFVWDNEGNRYLDAIAGIAVTNLGYGRDEIVDAIERQARRLPFSIANTFLNQPAIELARLVAALAPGDLSYVHFASGGSEAIEIAMKFARQYHVERGKPEKTTFISRWTSYHGATLAALSLTGSHGRRAKYEPLLLDVPHIPPCYCYRCPLALRYPSCEVRCADELERAILSVGAERVAAFVAEPVVASVGGAIGTPDEYFPMIREICDRHDVLLIADEIVTGFGRTGATFAVEHSACIPDLLVMGKGMSAGYSPLAGVAIREHIYDTFANRGVPFEHVFTYGGNPLSAAAGVAALEIFEREAIVRHVASVAPYFREKLQTLLRFPFVGDVRSIGLMAGLEFVADRDSLEPFPAERGFARLVHTTSLRHGLVTYPGTGMADGRRGDIISLYPPLIFTRDNIDEMVECLGSAFDEIAATSH
jgi:adenosylmethionine-8-amino-7-oxononanoate aminotransferase